MLKLYTYFRSSAAFRVRIALNLKNLPYEAVPIHLTRGGGEQYSDHYTRSNPSGLIPALQEGGMTLGQSLAIIEYLEERFPAPSLLPSGPVARAKVRELALSVACDIHPLANLRVLRYLESPLGLADTHRDEWARHWIMLGFTAIERLLAREEHAGPYCFGGTPTVADCCLVPQVFNARRVRLPMDDYQHICRVHDHCMQQEAFQRAAPGAQGDAE